MNKRSKKLYCVVAVLLVGMSAVLPSFSQAFLQGIQAEEKELDTYEEENKVSETKNEALVETILEEKGKLETPILELEEKSMEAQIKNEQSVVLGDEIAPANSITVMTEEQLIEAVNNPDISVITTGGIVPLSKPLIIDREIRFQNMILDFSGDAMINITSSGELILLASIVLEGSTTNDTWITIDGGVLNTSEPTSGLFSGVAIRPTTDVSTFIEIKNGGLFTNVCYLELGSLDYSNGTATAGIRLNGGTFIDVPRSFIPGLIRAERAIVSESGINRHEFNFSGSNVGDTVLISETGMPLYTNYEQASLTVVGQASLLGGWMLDSTSGANTNYWGVNPDFSLGRISFSVEQIGNFRPTIHELSSPEYSHLFFNGILPMFRGIRSANSLATFPPIRLPEDISVSQTKSDLLIGETTQLVETLTPDSSQLDTAEVIWVSENPEIARVDEHGIVTATGRGKTTITAFTMNGLSATAEINVEEFTFEFIGTDGNSTAIVTRYVGTDSDIEIPNEALNRDAGWTTPSPVVEVGAGHSLTAVNLTSVIIPANVKRVNQGAFYALRSLSKVTFNEGLEIIGNGSFSFTNLSEVVIPNSVIEVEGIAFADSNLASVELGNGIRTIGMGAFSSNKITSIVIPDKVTRMDMFAFSSNSLSDIHIGKGLKTINSSVFSGNELIEVEIPEGIETIEANAFANNPRLQTMIFSGEVSNMGDNVYSNSSLKEVIVSEDNIEHYRNLLSPSVFRGIVEKTILRIKESRYSDDTQSVNNLMVGEELSFSVLSKNRYQLANLESYLWEEANPDTQWFKNDQALAEETSRNFSIAEVEEADSGVYYAIVGGTQLATLSVEVSPLVQPDIPAINPEDGLLELEHTNPVIEGLSLRYVSDLHFGATTFSSSNQTLHANETDEIPKVTVQDMRSTSQRNGWELQVKQSQLFMDGAQLIFNPFVHEINQESLKIRAHTGALTVNTEAQRFAGTTTTENPSGIATMGMGSADGSGVSLQIPGGVGVGSYETTLIWNLVALPSKANEHIVEK